MEQENRKEANRALYDRIKESFDRQTFLQLIGAKLESVEPGKVVISCERRKDLSQQHGFIHAGVVSSIADVACGYAAMSMKSEGDVLAVEYKINLIRPAATDKVTATATVIKAGRTLTIAEASVTGTDGKLIAKMQSTVMSGK